MKKVFKSDDNKSSDDFFRKVYEVAKLIPSGRITSYGAIARYLGSGRSARMVGWAMNACHNSLEFIPAHRVVNRNGLLTGKFHFGNSTTMQQLLENEGLIIEDDRILNFDERFWDPSSELS
jgi:methylated-DNA-protein-cysteine methyltransferase-like protein